MLLFMCMGLDSQTTTTSVIPPGLKSAMSCATVRERLSAPWDGAEPVSNYADLIYQQVQNETARQAAYDRVMRVPRSKRSMEYFKIRREFSIKPIITTMQILDRIHSCPPPKVRLPEMHAHPFYPPQSAPSHPSH